MFRRDNCLNGRYKEIPIDFVQTEPGGLVILLEMVASRTSPVVGSSTTKINTGFSDAC